MGDRNPHNIMIRPIVTEKSEAQKVLRAYAFVVARDANKVEIRRAVEKIWDVQVAEVRTMLVKGKRKRLRFARGRRPDWKKAIVKLTEASKPIEIY